MKIDKTNPHLRRSETGTYIWDGDLIADEDIVIDMDREFEFRVTGALSTRGSVILSKPCFVSVYGSLTIDGDAKGDGNIVYYKEMTISGIVECEVECEAEALEHDERNRRLLKAIFEEISKPAGKNDTTATHMWRKNKPDFEKVALSIYPELKDKCRFEECYILEVEIERQPTPKFTVYFRSNTYDDAYMMFSHLIVSRCSALHDIAPDIIHSSNIDVRISNVPTLVTRMRLENTPFCEGGSVYTDIYASDSGEKGVYFYFRKIDINRGTMKKWTILPYPERTPADGFIMGLTDADIRKKSSALDPLDMLNPDNFTYEKLSELGPTHIELAVPVFNREWVARKGAFYSLARLLGISTYELEEILWYKKYIYECPDWEASSPRNEAISHHKYLDLLFDIDIEQIISGKGAQGIRDELTRIDFEALTQRFSAQLHASKEESDKVLLELLAYFMDIGFEPKDMIRTAIPIVIPPSLSTAEAFNQSGLRKLYSVVIARSSRIKALASIKSPFVILDNEIRLLQKSVDNLICDLLDIYQVESERNCPQV